MSNSRWGYYKSPSLGLCSSRVECCCKWISIAQRATDLGRLTCSHVDCTVCVDCDSQQVGNCKASRFRRVLQRANYVILSLIPLLIAVWLIIVIAIQSYHFILQWPIYRANRPEARSMRRLLWPKLWVGQALRCRARSWRGMSAKCLKRAWIAFSLRGGTGYCR
jgi:hypothetical protein